MSSEEKAPETESDPVPDSATAADPESSAEDSPAPPESDAVPDSGDQPESAAVTRSWLGVWSIALSVLGLGPLPVIGSVLGIVLGRLALRRGAGYRVVGGRPLAMVGFWLGVATLAVVAIAVTTYSLITAFAGR